MSTRIHQDDESPTEEDDPIEAVNEKRDLFERIADADLPMSERTRAMLDRIDEMEAEDA